MQQYQGYKGNKIRKNKILYFFLSWLKESYQNCTNTWELNSIKITVIYIEAIGGVLYKKLCNIHKNTHVLEFSLFLRIPI